MELSEIRSKNLGIESFFLIFFVIIGPFLSICLIPDSFTPTRLENVFILFILGGILFYKDLRFDKIFSIIILLFFLSILLSSLINIANFSNIIYSFRIFKFFLFFVIICHAANIHIQAVDFIVKLVFFILLLINGLQIFNPFGIGNLLTLIYTHHHEIVIALNQEIGRTFRLTGTMVNPNDNGVLWLSFGVYFMSTYYYKKGLNELLYLLICILMIILTQSRTTFLALIVVIIAYLLNFKFKRSMILALLGLLLLGVGLIFAFKLNYLTQIFVTNPLKVHSFQARFETWQHMIEMWKNKMIFGWGAFENPMKILNGTPDSEYLYVLVSSGIVGVIFYIGILLYPIIKLWKRRKQVYHGLLGILLPIGFAVIGITNFTILNVRIGLLYFLFVGVSFAMLNYSSDHRRNT